MRSDRNKDKKSTLSFIAFLFVIAIISYMSGYGHGQADSYLKKNDDHSITDVYMKKEK